MNNASIRCERRRQILAADPAELQHRTTQQRIQAALEDEIPQVALVVLRALRCGNSEPVPFCAPVRKSGIGKQTSETGD